MRNNEVYGDMPAWIAVTEIAAAIGRDKSTVSRTLSRARRRLYKCLRYGL